MIRKNPHSLPISLPTFAPFTKAEISALYKESEAIALKGGISLG
jgi:hypothetical protein